MIFSKAIVSLLIPTIKHYNVVQSQYMYAYSLTWPDSLHTTTYHLHRYYEYSILRVWNCSMSEDYSCW